MKQTRELRYNHRMDKKAKQILFDTYWTSGGWKRERVTAPQDFAYAKEKGVMFDPLTISHDECVVQIAQIVAAISAEQVAKAFLSSLSSRRLDWRSGIASYYIARQLPAHAYTPVPSGYSYENGKMVCVSYTCEICKNARYGIIGTESYDNEDLNVLNFERIKWGGVRHGDLLYTLFDLRQFQKESIPEPTEEDIAVFKAILNAIASCGKNDYPSALRDKLKDIPALKSNKDERSVIIEILACIGVLKPVSFDRPVSGRNDWHFAEYWRGCDGYDAAAVDAFFGKYL